MSPWLGGGKLKFAFRIDGGGCVVLRTLPNQRMAFIENQWAPQRIGRMPTVSPNQRSGEHKRQCGIDALSNSV